MADPIKFYSWERAGIYTVVTGAQAGRLIGEADLVVRDNGASIATRTVSFHIMGPRDIGGIERRAILRTTPRALSQNNETTKSVHVDFRAADFVWRYTPEQADEDILRPWIVLLVGLAENLSVNGDNLEVDDATLIAHDLREAARWAHVHEEGGQRISRLLSPRPLIAQREYVAAIVPAFNEDGLENWVVSGTDPNKQLDERPLRLACYHHWRFWTGEEGDFETLAAALQVRENDGSLGQAALRYERNAVSATMTVRGAITALGATVDPPPQDVVNDLDGINNEVSDPQRPVLGMPIYGRPWHSDPEPTDWGDPLNKWPQFRGIAGLGLWIGIEAQEQLVNAAVTQTGALTIVEQRIRALAAGLLNAQSLWRRRLPADPRERLMLLGSTSRRLRAKTSAGAQGSVLDLVTGAGRPLPRAIFASGVRRLLRPNTALARHLSTGIVPPRVVILQQANTCPPPPERNPDGYSHVDAATDDFGFPPLDELLGIDKALPDDIRQLIDRVAGKVTDIDSLINDLGALIFDQLQQLGKPLELDRIFEELQYLHLFNDKPVDGELLAALALVYFRRTEDTPEEFAEFIYGLHIQEIHPDELANELAEWIASLLKVNQAQIFALVRPDVEIYATRPVYSREALVIVNHFFLIHTDGKPPDHLGEYEFDPVETPDWVIEELDPMPEEPCRPADLDGLDNVITGAIDPTGPTPPVVEQVLETIDGVTGIAPPEVCVGLDFPTWGLLRQYAKEWLLPGAGQMAKNSIMALESNPAFIDAFLVGLNTQMMNELHWRNIAVHPLCTPLRMFWGQVDYANAGERQQDIHGIDQWAPNTKLGDTTHQVLPPDDAAGKRDLVMLFRTDLFRRYPGTLVYLIKDDNALPDPPAVLTGAPDFLNEVDHIGPIFQGRIEEDIVFFTFDINPDDLDQYWLVLEEPPADLRFRNDVASGASDGAHYAEDTLDAQTRVAISGLFLEMSGT
jgi:hypothetical protein